jgi:hypothetical protein
MPARDADGRLACCAERLDDGDTAERQPERERSAWAAPVLPAHHDNRRRGAADRASRNVLGAEPERHLTDGGPPAADEQLHLRARRQPARALREDRERHHQPLRRSLGGNSALQRVRTAERGSGDVLHAGTVACFGNG